MIRILLFTTFATTTIAAQSDVNSLRRHGIKFDLTGIAHRRAGLAYEWRINMRSGLEVQLSYTNQNPIRGAKFFHGNLTAAYAVRAIRQSMPGPLPEYLLPEYASGYFGNGRPLPELDHTTVPLSTVQGRFGYRITYPENKWRFFLQPSVSVARHVYVEIKDQTDIQKSEYRSWQLTQENDRVEQITTHYSQTRQMRLQRHWYGGLHYELGTAFPLKWGLEIEARCGLGFNIGKYPYKIPRIPYTLNEVHTHASIRLVYFWTTKKRALERP